ncbi:hypothetical protein Tco_1153354 [Tanacetum coccineum]
MWRIAKVDLVFSGVGLKGKVMGLSMGAVDESGMLAFEILAPPIGGFRYPLENYIILFPNLRVMVPLSNLITALAIVRNGVPKMKGLFSFSLISKIIKSTRPFVDKFHVSRVGHDVHIRPLIDEGVHVLKAPYDARFYNVVECLIRLVTPFFLSLTREIEFTFLVTGNLASSLINTFSGVLLVANKRDEWLVDLQATVQAEINTLRQKSQIRWAVEGDENS